jgi:hypothetical protein
MGRFHDVLRTQSVGLHRFNRKKLTRGNLLEGSCVEDEVHAMHRLQNAVITTHITQIKLDCGVTDTPPHVFLLFLFSAENTNFPKAGRARHVDHSIAEGARTAGDQEGLIREYGWGQLIAAL